MSGYLCVAMVLEPPFELIMGVTENPPEYWFDELHEPSSGVLLCYENFFDPKNAEWFCIQELEKLGIILVPGEPFAAPPSEVLRIFMQARDNANRLSDSPESSNPAQLSMDTAIFDGKQLYNLAEECEFGSETAFELYLQSAELGYKRAYTALAKAYLNAWGVKKSLNTAMSWASKIKTSDFAELDTFGRSEAGDLFHSLAAEFENGSDQAITDRKKAFKLNLKAAQFGNEMAYTSLALAYMTGDGVGKNLNSALEWAQHEIDAGIILGYNHATTCFVEAGMKPQAENLWKRCFLEQPIEKISAACLRTYIKQAANGYIAIDQDIEKLFAPLAESIKKIQKELGVTIYEDEIAWLGDRDTCIVCHIPIAPETARKTEGKCLPCFIKSLT